MIRIFLSRLYAKGAGLFIRYPFGPCKLSTVGKLLQQRSALSLLAEVYDELKTADFGGGRTITPVDLCSDSLVNEFLSSERFGQLRGFGSRYETVLDKYRHELGCEDVRVLKSVLLSSKLGTKAKSMRTHLLCYRLLWS